MIEPIFYIGLKKWGQLSHLEKKMAVEGLYFLLIARLALWFIPFKIIAKRLGHHMKETPHTEIPKNRKINLLVQKTIGRLSDKTPWESTCLVQAIAAKTILNRRRIGCTLYFGMAKDKRKNKGFKAHAWLRSGRLLITGSTAEKPPGFTVVSFFGDVKQ